MKMLNWLMSKNIKKKFIYTSVLLAIISNLFIYILWYQKTSSDIENNAALYVEGILKISNDHFNSMLQDINGLISFYTLSSAGGDSMIRVVSRLDRKNPFQYVKDSNIINDNLSNIYRFRHYVKGAMVSSINEDNFSMGITLPFDTLSQQDWYSDILKSEDKLVIIPPYSTSDPNVKLNNNDMVFALAKPLYDGGVPIGAMIINIDCKIFKEVFGQKLISNEAILVFDSKSNEIIYNSNNNSKNYNFSDSKLKEISLNISSNKDSFYTIINGKKYLTIYKKSPLTQWTTVCFTPMDKLLQNSNSTFKTILYASIVFLVIQCVAIHLISSVLTSNLLKLNKAVKRIDKDNLDISLNINTKDEVGQLYIQFNNMVLRIKELINNIQKTEQEKAKLEIKALQAQINPHFLYNTLNTIKFLAILQGADSIKNVSEALSKLMHINMSRQSFISVKEEIEYLEAYLYIQNYKYSNKFKCSFDIDEQVNKYMIPKLLLQPIVENSIIHGIAPLPVSGVIKIIAYKQERFLKISIQDNGVGIAEEDISRIYRQSDETSNIGLQNVISRIKVYFGDNYGVNIQSESNKYTIVELTLPLINSEGVKNYV